MKLESLPPDLVWVAHTLSCLADPAASLRVELLDQGKAVGRESGPEKMLPGEGSVGRAWG